MITRKNLIKEYLKFFESKNHRIIPSASLVPENNPTVLFTTAGMHPLIPYLLGQKHPLGKRLVNVQKCVRTTDIEEVGDNSHHTFIEMLGNWSLGDYWKKEAIGYSFEFLTKVLKISKEEITVTCFRGDKDAPKDTESGKIWKSLGIKKIKFLGKKENWWGPAGKTGPCGPDTEMFVKNIEIWNDVFMQYNKTSKGNYEPLKQKNVDTGMGVERVVAILNGYEDNYLTNLWQPIIKKIENLSGKKYKGNEKAMRIIADHIKASVFIIADGVLPSNMERGYILRRLIRRSIRYGKKLEIKDFTSKVAEPVFGIYDNYPELKKNKSKILQGLKKEEDKFNKTLMKGLTIFNKLSQREKSISGKDAFLLYQSYGFPIELTEEITKEKRIKVDTKGFEKEYEKHQKLSRTATKGTFKSGLSDSSKETTKLHTATHLLNEALGRVLDKNIRQKGSNITPERLRFDFNFPRKLSEEELKKVEDLVNKKISEGLKVTHEEMPLKKALKIGASSEFSTRYPEIVKIYTIGEFSKEICTGPHVTNTREIGKFRIIKEESVAADVRRIKAVVK